MRKESDVILKRYSHSEVSRKGRIILFNINNCQIYLIETGIGLQTSEIMIKQYIQEISPALIFNYGICGSLHSNIKQYESFLIKEVHTPDQKPINLKEHLSMFTNTDKPEMTQETLLTVTKPILNQKQRRNVTTKYSFSLVDMEGYHLAKIATEMRIPILIIKVVSDYANQDTKRVIQKNTGKWQEKLWIALSILGEKYI